MQNTRETSPVAHDPMVHDLHVRVSRIEQDSRTQITEMAVMKNDMAYVKQSVNSIQSGVTRILWAIGLSMVAAISTFLLNGGLAGGIQ